MDQDTHAVDNQDATLEPPGTIAVIGATPLGLEAALYGRFLGYDVRIVESDSIANELTERRDQPLPMTPSRCCSPLAWQAIETHATSGSLATHPTTIAEWIDNVWVHLSETDLLRGRLVCPAQVGSLELIAAETEDEEEVPPDFRIKLNDSPEGPEAIDVEAILWATGVHAAQSAAKFSIPCDYFHLIEPSEETGDEETRFWNGLKRIVKVYASLGGRKDLDLYRPTRGE
ncbi:MAG: hypothetical protein AAFV88_03115 [Planctomycetota bacterium]